VARHAPATHSASAVNFFCMFVLPVEKNFGVTPISTAGCGGSRF